MTSPSVVSTVKLEESATGTNHVLPAFSNVQAHDVLYAVWALSGQVDPAFNGWSGNGNYVYYKSAGITLVRTVVVDADGTEGTYTVSAASTLAAAVGIQIRGAGVVPTLGSLNKMETLPAWSSNPESEIHPGISRSDERMPTKDTDGSGTQVDSRLVAAFARLGTTTFLTNLTDPFGNGASNGAPYVYDKNNPDGSFTSSFNHADHANSTAGATKLQVGMAHRGVASGKWGGHPNWDAYVFQGQVQVSRWTVNADTDPAVQTGTFGLRVKGT